ncbi:MAG TPA: hypothetical protein VL251_05990 [Thermomonas sp.]|jgi:hypothetical protein|nr:hypothetical protein [Thermomonas sp.]
MNNGPDRMGEAELRLALRGLRRDVAPAHDLWPGIEARLHGLPRQRRQPRNWLLSLATAASLVLAVGLAWQLQPGPGPQGGEAGPAAPSLVQREAQGMTVQYQAALREMDPDAIPASWRPGIQALDRSAGEIRQALRQNPDSRLLLERLRDTYTRRLELSRRALYV